MTMHEGLVDQRWKFKKRLASEGALDIVFPNTLDAIVDILNDVKAHAVPGGAA